MSAKGGCLVYIVRFDFSVSHGKKIDVIGLL